MADGAGKNIVLIGVAAAGAYVIYEYSQYSRAMSAFGSSATVVETALPFWTWMSAKLMGTSSLNSTQVQAFNLINQAATGTLPMTQAPTPGTTAVTQPTTVSTAPTTTTTPAATTPTATPTVTQPSAFDLQNTIKMTLASADQWDYGYRELMGYGIERIYNFNFDKVYGAVVNGKRNNGQLISANAFLNAPRLFGYTKTANLSGFGAIARYWGPDFTTVGNMMYRAHHPSPHGVTAPRRLGLGAVEAPSGFEKALWAGARLRSNQYR